jgi:uncharacterized protein (DUF305 family)
MPTAFATPLRSVAAVLVLTLPLLVQSQGLAPVPANSARASNDRPCLPADWHRCAVLERGELFKPTGNPDRDFASMMRAHHQEGVDMANLELANGKSSKLRAMARRIIKDQQREIAELDKWIARHNVQLSSE